MAALGLRAVQLYHHASQKMAAEASIARARTFLETQPPKATEEHAYRLIGLKWAGADRSTLQRFARELKAAQREDGGWGALPGRASDVYATAQALVALHEGGVGDIDPGWRRGIGYLLKAQATDGSWRLTSRLAGSTSPRSGMSSTSTSPDSRKTTSTGWGERRGPS